MGDDETAKQANKRIMHGSPIFYQLLEEMANIHDIKSHDYASDSDPFGNYHFAGQLSKLFNNADDAGFVGRLGEKLYRLANLENSEKKALNEPVEDTERDISVIVVLWMADRRERRNREMALSRADEELAFYLNEDKYLKGNSVAVNKCKYCGIKFTETPLTLIRKEPEIEAVQLNFCSGSHKTFYIKESYTSNPKIVYDERNNTLRG